MDTLRITFKRVIWAGILANMLFVIPLVFFPGPFFALLGIELTDTILARASGILLFTISVFYIPAAQDVDRYRANAWIHCAPSRFGGAVFFATAVLVFDYPLGYLSIAIVDAVFMLWALVLLFRITAEERAAGQKVSLW